MTAAKNKRRSGNPAKPPKPQYRPAIWHRNHRFAVFGIVGATALTLLAGFLGPSAVALTLGPRDSYLPPWYLPAGVIKPNEWFVSILVWSAILGALGLWVGLRAMADGWKPKPRKLFALGSYSACSYLRAADDIGRRLDVRGVRAAAGDRARSVRDHACGGVPRAIRSGAPLDRAAVAGHPQRVRSDHLLDAARRQQTRRREHARHRVLAAGVLGGALHPGVRGRIPLGARRHPSTGRAALLTIANPLLIWAVVAGATASRWP